MTHFLPSPTPICIYPLKKSANVYEFELICHQIYSCFAMADLRCCPCFMQSRSGGEYQLLHLASPSSLFCSTRCATSLLFRLTIAICGIVTGFALYHRTTNMWTLKNLGDSILVKSIGSRPIVLGAFHRMPQEKNVRGHFAVFQFLGDGRQSHTLFCLSTSINGKEMLSQAHIQRIHQGKRAANDLCSWSGHLAECEIADGAASAVKLSTQGNLLSFSAAELNDRSISVQLEQPLQFGMNKLPLVICLAPMYTYTEWQIMITGIETWLALGASKLVFPIQSASADTLLILREYERMGIVLLRHWPKWPVLSDVNTNGLVLSRGIEESHVNCLHFVKPFADMVVITDIDDMLMPIDPMQIRPGVNMDILKELFHEHPNAGSLLFEHRDVQFVLPEPPSHNSLSSFNFGFLAHSRWKTSCKVWRMKTRVAVNASRVDSVNMHETGIHRFGYAQVRIPCRRAHFYHLRHSYANIALNEAPINMSVLQKQLQEQWQHRMNANFNATVRNAPLQCSSVESFADFVFDKCMGAINTEHWSTRVSRCLTPHVCFSRLARNISCVASVADFEFVHSNGDYLIVQRNANFVDSEPNCEAPLPKFTNGNHFYMP